MSNNILKYTSKDYNSILDDLIEAIPSLTSLWTSREDGDPGIVLVKLMSALGDMLSYNLDKQALEYYAPTVTQRKNAAKLFELVGYRMHWYRTAETQVTLENKATMPDYITYIKQVVDLYNSDDPNKDTKITNLIQSYCLTYKSSTDIGSQNTTAIPPIVGDSTSNTSPVSCPQSMVNAGVNRFIFDLGTGTSYPTVNDFYDAAQVVYSYWQQDNLIGLHTFISDPLRSLELYSSDMNGVTYSLIPTINSGSPVNGVYPPTVTLKPYEPQTFKAIQGYIASTTFTSSQLKNNMFYVPNANLDENHMYLCYTTDIGNNMQSEPIFIPLSDNLLLETDGQLHFQFRVDEFDYPYIELSSYWKDILGESNVTFIFYYFRTVGKNGSITKDYLSRANSSGSAFINVTNEANTEYLLDNDGNIITSPGYNPQTAYDAYVDSLNYIMTYNTIVTIYDFQRFCNRQNGISNSFACDGQYADDLNKNLRKVIDSYTFSQLVNILGIDPPVGATKETLADMLYEIQKVNAVNSDNCLTVEDTQETHEETQFLKYGINIYPIWENYKTVNQDGVEIAVYDNSINLVSDSPYNIYRIHVDTDPNVTDEQLQVATYLDAQFDKCRIVNVMPVYVGMRVFPWRCCGTLHLTKSVSQEDANNIIKNVVNKLQLVYSPENVIVGEKIDYMNVIDTILSADNRIRYFDAGLGSKKLIEYEQLVTNGPNKTYFNTEAYFNPVSIMRYVQTYAEIKNSSSPYYNYISIDPRYIQS